MEQTMENKLQRRFFAVNSSVSRNNCETAGPLDFAPPAGGGVDIPSISSSIGRTGYKTKFKRSLKVMVNQLRSFSAQVEILACSGQKRPNVNFFAKDKSLQKTSISSENMLAREK